MSHNKSVVIALLIAGGCFSDAGFAQEQPVKKKDVPKIVLATFQQSYPKATIKGYAKETDEGTVVYEIESMEGTVHRDVTYTADGNVASVEESLAYSELPESIRDAMTREYPNAKVSMCEKVTKGTVTKFELVVQSGIQKSELVFNADGSLEKTEKK